MYSTRFFQCVFFILFLIFIQNCKNENLTTSDNSNLQLTFSSDTIKFDTIISEKQSITKRLRIYNNNSNAIFIDHISLNYTHYQVLINGIELKSTPQSLTVNGKDSILILISLKLTSKNYLAPYLVEDEINIHWNQNQKFIKLLTWGYDAYFYNKKVVCDTAWGKGKAIVIKDTLKIEKNCTLTIEAGTKIYFEPKSSIVIYGILLVKGNAGDRVKFSSIRQDEAYKMTGGQWEGFYFKEGSTNNLINFALIENANIGVSIETNDMDTIPDISIQQTIIRNMNISGIHSLNSDVFAQNILIYNVNKYAVELVNEGYNTFYNCTFVNISSNFYNSLPLFQIKDNTENATNQKLKVKLINNIFWGLGNKELFIDSKIDNKNILITHNVIRYDEDLENNFTSTEKNYPGFIDLETQNYNLDPESICISNAIFINTVKLDVYGKMRDQQPDIGAIEFLK